MTTKYPRGTFAEMKREIDEWRRTANNIAVYAGVEIHLDGKRSPMCWGKTGAPSHKQALSAERHNRHEAERACADLSTSLTSAREQIARLEAELAAAVEAMGRPTPSPTEAALAAMVASMIGATPARVLALVRAAVEAVKAPERWT